MAGITKQKRSYMNKPIGVTRFETGETQMWESVANAATTLNRIALKEGSKQAEQSGMDAAMALDQAKIFAFNPETGSPEALDSNLMSGGIVARDAYKRTIQARFRDSLESELQNKALELKIKYPANENSFREEMSRYVANMHENAQGKWKETVKVGGVAIINSTAPLIAQESIRRENAKTGQAYVKKRDDWLNIRLPNLLKNYEGAELNARIAIETNDLEEQFRDAEDVNSILASGFTNEFNQLTLTSIGIHTAKIRINNSKNKIPTNSTGTPIRNEILHVLNGGYDKDLSPQAEKIITELREMTGNNSAILKDIATAITPEIDYLNKEAINQSVFESVETTFDLIEKSKNNIYIDKNIDDFDLSDGGEIERNFEKSEKDFENKYLELTNVAGADSERKAITDSMKNDRQKLVESLVYNLFVGKEPARIDVLQAALTGNTKDVFENFPNQSPPTSNEISIINFMQRNNLNTKGFEGQIGNAKQAYNGNKGLKVQDQRNELANTRDAILREIELNDYETNKEIINTFINETKNLEGKYSLLDNLSLISPTVNTLLNKLSESSMKELTFANSTEIAEAEAWASSQGQHNLQQENNLKILKRTVNINGNYKSIATILSTRRQDMAILEAANQATAKQQQLVNNVLLGYASNTPQNQKLAYEVLVKNNIPEEETLNSILSNPNKINQYPKVLNSIEQSLELGIIPDGFNQFMKKQSTGIGNTAQSSIAALALFERFENNVNEKTLNPQPLLINNMDGKTYALFDVANTIKNEEGEAKALDFFQKANLIDDDKEIKSFSVWLGDPKGNINEKTETFTRWAYNNVNSDLLNDTEAMYNFEIHARYLKLSGYTPEETEIKLKESYERKYPIDLLVEDYGRVNINRTIYALDRAMPIPEVKQAYIANAQKILAFHHPEVRLGNYEDMHLLQGLLSTKPEDIRAREDKKLYEFESVLVAMPGAYENKGGAEQNIYGLYKKLKGGGRELLTIPDEFGDEQPILLGTQEQYLLDIMKEVQKKKMEISEKDIIKSKKWNQQTDEMLRFIGGSMVGQSIEIKSNNLKTINTFKGLYDGLINKDNLSGKTDAEKNKLKMQKLKEKFNGS